MKSKSNKRRYATLALWIGITLTLASCGLLGEGGEEMLLPSDTPVVAEGATSTPTLVAALATATPQAEAMVTATPLEEVMATATFTPVPPTATPQPTTAMVANTAVPATTAVPTCGPPPHWIRYTVRAGDNLFRLALNTGTTVGAIMQANCLTSERIDAGQELFLPRLPPTPTTPPAASSTTPPPASSTTPPPASSTTPPPASPTTPPPASPTTPPPASPTTPAPTITDTPVTEEPPEEECTGDFCPNPELAGTLTLDPGGPNNAAFTPCQAVTQPRLEFDSTTDIVELGQRRYIYVCVPDPAFAILTRTGGQTQPVNLLSTLPNPDLKPGNAHAFIDWPALPFELTGVYTMTVVSGDSTEVDFPFLVVTPSTERILVVPQASARGSTFQVYYVNFNLNSTATIELYGEENPVVGGFHEMSLLNTHTVNIDQPLAGSAGKGWTQESLVSSTDDQAAAYSLTFDNRRVFDLFWLR